MSKRLFYSLMIFAGIVLILNTKITLDIQKKK